VSAVRSGVRSLRRPGFLGPACILLITIVAVPSADAQGKGKGNGHGSPPSRNSLPSPTVIDHPGGSTTPFAWLDDANLLAPGAVSFGISVLHWQGTGVSETDVPVFDVAMGVMPRVQVGAMIPHVVGSTDPTGPAGGLGTTYFGGKFAVVDDTKQGFKLAVSPMMEVLGAGVVEVLGPDVGRVHWGLPVSLESDLGSTRLYGAGGYFSRGIWFVGGGVGVQATPRVTVSMAFSHAWAPSPTADVTANLRNELSGSAAYAVTPHVGVFGSIGRTIATDDASGAGTTIGGGVTFFVSAPTTAINRDR